MILTWLDLNNNNNNNNDELQKRAAVYGYECNKRIAPCTGF